MTTLREMKLSVIVCTHNPRPGYLSRTLDALRAQTMQYTDWEVILVDNASAGPLASRIDLSWHPRGIHVREEELGLTPARLNGIAKAKGDLLIFVDDDNVVQRDYLEVSSRLATTYPHLGAFGGSIKAEFEAEPDPRLQALLPGLAIRAVKGAKWANFGTDAVPFGAGLCVRAKVAQAYAAKANGSDIRLSLDRRGNSLMGGGDLDLAMTSYDLGMGVGLFGELVVTHLIDKRRLSRQYLHEVCERGAYGFYIVRYLHAGIAPQYRGTIGFVVDSFKRLIRTCLGRPWTPAEKASREAERRAARDIHLLNMNRKIEIQQM